MLRRVSSAWSTTATCRTTRCLTSLTAETWYFKGGLRTKFNHLGATVFYGEYLTADGAGSTSLLGPENWSALIESDVGTIDELNVWGLGIVQEVDAAAMSVWIKYRNASVDTTT